MTLLAAFLALSLNPSRGVGTSTPPTLPPPSGGATWEDGASAQWETGATLEWQGATGDSWESGAAAQWETGAILQWESS